MTGVDDTIETLLALQGEEFTIDAAPAVLGPCSQTAQGPLLSTVLIFETDGPHGFEQGNRTVSHPDLGDTVLFVVPNSSTQLCVTFTTMAPSGA
jgi:hypothetical protein